MKKPSLNFKAAAIAHRNRKKSGHSMTQSLKTPMKSSSFFNMLEKVKKSNKTRKF
jgi:hypothetical protein